MTDKAPGIDVRYVADLARVDLDEAATEKLQKELESILDYVNLLNELDVSDIEPTAHAAAMTNVLRDDVAGATFERDDMLRAAPATVDDELIRVPQVIPGEEEL